MTKKEDNELIKEVKNIGCNESFKELLNRHSNLYYKICQKYLPTLKRMGVNSDDVLNDKEYVFFKSLTSFQPDKKTKFSTWLGNFTRYHCLNYINTYKKYSTQELFEELEATPSVPRADGAEYIYSILSQLKDERIIKVYRMRYENNGDKKATWSNIAKKMKISTQTAINLHARGKKMIKKKIESKNCYDFI
jgi:RNA polymerase sigma factor (sigma-70 family)